MLACHCFSNRTEHLIRSLYDRFHNVMVGNDLVTHGIKALSP